MISSTIMVRVVATGRTQLALDLDYCMLSYRLVRACVRAPVTIDVIYYYYVQGCQIINRRVLFALFFSTAYYKSASFAKFQRSEMNRGQYIHANLENMHTHT
jgi:hypothetical protein